MKEITLICDNCKRRSDSIRPVRAYMVQKGKDPDPSGNGYLWNWEQKDFCLSCLLNFARLYTDHCIKESGEGL